MTRWQNPRQLDACRVDSMCSMGAITTLQPSGPLVLEIQGKGVFIPALHGSMGRTGEGACPRDLPVRQCIGKPSLQSKERAI